MKTLQETLRETERRYLVDVLAHHQGRVAKAAEASGVNRTAFYRKLDEHGISRRKYTLGGLQLRRA